MKCDRCHKEEEQKWPDPVRYHWIGAYLYCPACCVPILRERMQAHKPTYLSLNRDAADNPTYVSFDWDSANELMLPVLTFKRYTGTVGWGATRKRPFVAFTFLGLDGRLWKGRSGGHHWFKASPVTRKERRASN